VTGRFKDALVELIPEVLNALDDLTAGAVIRVSGP
jgi:hypothetical protein